jgi:DNA-binding protein HU-beta
MNKQELIDAIAKESKLSKASSKKALEALTKAVKLSLKKGDRVAIAGFGSFSVVKRKARIGRNPQTGKEIKIKARKAAKFTSAKALKTVLG